MTATAATSNQIELKDYGTRARCSFPGCDKPIRKAGLCNAHVTQKYRGEELRPLRVYADRPIVPHPEFPGASLVPLTQGYSAVIDAADAEAVGAHRWHAVVRPASSRTIYAAASVDGRTVKLHAFLWALWKNPPADEVDHQDGNGLDCRRSNLRAATRRQNAANQPMPRHNTSGAKGVRQRPSGRWEACITVAGQWRFLGTFAEKADAIDAYNAAALQARGEFARLSTTTKQGGDGPCRSS